MDNMKHSSIGKLSTTDESKDPPKLYCHCPDTSIGSSLMYCVHSGHRARVLVGYLPCMVKEVLVYIEDL